MDTTIIKDVLRTQSSNDMAEIISKIGVHNFSALNNWEIIMEMMKEYRDARDLFKITMNSSFIKKNKAHMAWIVSVSDIVYVSEDTSGTFLFFNGRMIIMKTSSKILFDQIKELKSEKRCI